MSLDALGALAPLVADDPRKRSETGDPAHELDRLFARVLLKEVTKALKSGPLFGGKAAQAFEGIWVEELADRIAESGLGVADSWLGRSAAFSPGPQALSVAPDRPAGVSVARVTSAYGWRTDPFDGTHRRHDGVDIGAPAGTEIPAVRDGTVVYAGDRGGYGRVVIVDHGDGLQTRYAHCRELRVQEGAQVRAGDTLATVGSTGRATGPHLHLEARQDGVHIDPSEFLGDFFLK